MNYFLRISFIFILFLMTSVSLVSDIVSAATSRSLQVDALILEVLVGADVSIENLEENYWHPGFSFTEYDDITIEGKHYLNLDTAVQGLSNLSGVKILSRPKIVTLNNNTATINMGSDGPAVVEGMESLQFEITPKILEDGRIHQAIILSARWKSKNGLSSINEAETEIVTPKEGKIFATYHTFRDYQQYAKYILILMSTKEYDQPAYQEMMIRSTTTNNPLPGSVSEKTQRPSTTVTRIMLSRVLVDSAMENLTERMTIKPYSEEGIESLKLGNIEEDSIFRRMGLRNGDVLVAVEGEPVTKADQALLLLYKNLKSSDTFSLEINREGHARKIEYRIQ